MPRFFRMLGLAAVYLIALSAWVILGGSMQDRSRDQKHQLGDAVSSLWGTPQAQAAPQLVFFPEGEVGQKVMFPIDRNTQETTILLDGELLPVVTAPDGSKHVYRQQGPRGVPVSLASSAIGCGAAPPP